MKKFKILLILFIMSILYSCNDYKYTLVYEIQYSDTTKIDTLYSNSQFNFGYAYGYYYISISNSFIENYKDREYYYDKYPLRVFSYTKERLNN